MAEDLLPLVIPLCFNSTLFFPPLYFVRMEMSPSNGGYGRRREQRGLVEDLLNFEICLIIRVYVQMVT